MTTFFQNFRSKAPKTVFGPTQLCLWPQLYFSALIAQCADLLAGIKWGELLVGKKVLGCCIYGRRGPTRAGQGRPGAASADCDFQNPHRWGFQPGVTKKLGPTTADFGLLLTDYAYGNSGQGFPWPSFFGHFCQHCPFSPLCPFSSTFAHFWPLLYHFCPFLSSSMDSRKVQVKRRRGSDRR